MGYFFLILQAVIFSFGGLMVKAAGTMFSPYMMSMLRFLIGTLLLLIIQKVRTGRVHLTLTLPVIIAGGLCKALHYLPENYGILQGFSYGGILVWPVQTVVVLLFSVIIYREKPSLRMLLGTLLCVSGIGIVSWNGAPLSVFMQSQASTLLAFILAGIGAAGFTLSQKKMVNAMDIVEMNSSMFTFGLLTTCIVLFPTAPHFTGNVNAPGIICMSLLGIITCVGFLLQAAAIKTVPLLAATIIQSSSVILNIVWGVLFYKDPISAYIIAGSAIFLTGILLVNLPQRKKTVPA